MFNVDVIIFIAFLALNLIVGIGWGRGVKTIGDYALGGRNFSTGAIVATIVATWASGSGFFITLQNTYSDGLYYVIAASGISMALLIFAIFLIPRMGEFLGKISIAEAMGDLYGNKVRLITAIAGTIGSIGSIAVQFKVFGSVFEQFLEFTPTDAILLSGVVVTLYSAFGGIRSVTFTDILQFMAFGLTLPLLGVLIWNKLRGLKDFSLLNAFSDPKFDFSLVLDLGNPKFLDTIPLLLYFAIPFVDQTAFQRVAIGKDIRQVKKAFFIAAFLFCFMELSTSWISFLIFNIDKSLDSGKLIPYIVSHYTYPGLKAMLIIIITAMAMSTADSLINASAVLFAHDICSSVTKIKPGRELVIARIFSIALGCFGIGLALKGKGLLKIILYAYSFYMPLVTPIFLFAVLGFRSQSLPVLVGMFAGLATVLVWHFIGIEMDPIVIAMGINCIFFFATHYLFGFEGGWVGVKDRKALDEAAERRAEARRECLEYIRNFNLIEFFRSTAPKNELTYSGLGVFCFFATIGTMYSTDAEFSGDATNILMLLYAIMLPTSVVLAMYPMWPRVLRKYEIIPQAAWHFVIFYMLCFFATFFILVSDFGGLQLFIFALSSMSAILLTGWKRGGFLIALGLYAGSRLFDYYKIGAQPAESKPLEPVFLLLYALIMLAGTVLIFFRPKETEYALSEGRVRHLAELLRIAGDPIAKAKEMREEFIKNIQHETNNPLTGITSMAETLDACYDRLKEKDIKDSIKTILASSVRLETFTNNLINLSKAANGKLDPQISSVDLSSLLAHRVEICKKLHGANEKQEFALNIENNIFMDGDKNYLACAFDNIILNAINYCAEGEIKITLRKIGKDIEFSAEDQGIGIPENQLSGIFDSFEVSSKTRTPAGGRGVGLSLAKAVAEFHGGTIKAEPGRKKGAKFTILFDRS